jgi:FtsH-binding integral membrane protein
MQKFSRFFRIAAPVLVATTPLLASAAIFNNINDVASKVCGFVNIMFTGAIILTIVFVLLAGIKYITKGSDPKEVSSAHQMLVWGAIGFAVAVMAGTLPKIVAGLLGASALSYPAGC